MITRTNQTKGIFYQFPNGSGFVVADDGIGRYYYGDIGEAMDDCFDPKLNILGVNYEDIED